MPFFKCLLEVPSEDCDLESLHLLLSSMLKARGLSSSVIESTLTVYLASRMKDIQVREALCGNEQNFELSFLFKSQNDDSTGQMDALKQLSPNVVSRESLAHYLEQGLVLS